MSEVGSAIDEVRSELAGSAGEFLPGTCSLIPPTTVSDGFSGHKLGEGTPIQNVPCKVEAVSGGFQVNEGGAVVTKSHRVTLPVTADTVAINRHYKIKVNAVGLNAEIVLDQPVALLGQMDVFLTVAASLAEGYRQPAMT